MPVEVGIVLSKHLAVGVAHDGGHGERVRSAGQHPRGESVPQVVQGVLGAELLFQPLEPAAHGVSGPGLSVLVAEEHALGI